MNLRAICSHLLAAAQRLTTRFRPAMTGTPPSARQVPAHPELHALDFAERYAELLDYHAAQTMIALGIPRDQIGAAPLCFAYGMLRSIGASAPAAEYHQKDA